ncbi:MAG: MerR family transcriptional regulator [Actinobacteria bacterium]|nr:MerR family transcriptional regulator [Actinomycetota bacterium]
MAERAGTTVRNVRAYQDRGLLPPPRRSGRVAFYSEVHLARLRLIGRLVERGYTLASIGELLQAWEAGHDIGEVLGLEEAINAPWATEAPETVTAAELAARFGVEPADGVPRAVELGLLVPDADGERYRVPSPRLLQVATVLHAAGVPLDAILDAGAALRAETDRIAALFTGLAMDHVVDADRIADAAPDELAAKAEVVRRLRPLAEAATVAALAQSMDRATTERLSQELERHFGRARDGSVAAPSTRP